MTKVELAKAVATEMKKVRSDVNVERMTIVFTSSMTKRELECALRGFTKCKA